MDLEKKGLLQMTLDANEDGVLSAKEVIDNLITFFHAGQGIHSSIISMCH